MTDLPRVPDLGSSDPGLPRLVWLLMVVIVAVALWLLVAPPQLSLEMAATEQSDPQATVEIWTGGSLFVREGCGACHATAGPSTALGPSLAGALTQAEERLGSPGYSGFAESPQSYIREATLDHCIDGALRYGYDCQALSDVGLRLSDEQVDRLVDFLAALPGGRP